MSPAIRMGSSHVTPLFLRHFFCVSSAISKRTYYFDRFLLDYENRFEREYGYLRPVIQEVTAGHHEACKAVVISLCIALNRMRLPRRLAPRNDVLTVAIRSVGLQEFVVLTVGRKCC